MNAEFQEDDGVRRVNHYILKREIGRGSFGVVHLGVDSTTGEEFVPTPRPPIDGRKLMARQLKSFQSPSYGNDRSR